MINEKNRFEFLRNRRSIRKYLPKEVPVELIDRVIDAARWAPSAHNAQPWRFFVLTKREDKEKLAKEMGQRFRRDLEKDGIPMGLADVRVRESFSRLVSSPILVVACIDMSIMDHYPDKMRQKAEEVMATQSLAAAIQNLLLGATVLGLGGCWYCAPLFCQDVINKVLNIPGHHIPQALITLGFPDEVPSPPQRRQINEIRKIL